jgi:CheY-like chemotaxis protein
MRLTEAVLVELGYRIRSARSAQEAMEILARDSHFDAVLSDLVMPGSISGIDLARRLRISCPELPVVLTTGYSDLGDSAQREGMRLLRKPYPAAELARLLDETISAPHSTRTPAGPVGGDRAALTSGSA